MAQKEYPGRVIIIGLSPSAAGVVVVYAITGRSPSSQARFMSQDEQGIWVRPTDKEILETGNPDLLIYPAVLFGKGVAISNGRQTESIKNALPNFQDARTTLESGLSGWIYEPDAPAFTPRISGCVLPQRKAALSIIKRSSDGTALKEYFDISLLPGRGRMIATYEGKNTDPLPSFAGPPQTVFFAGETSRETAMEVYRSLSPANEHKDFRVAVACVVFYDTEMQQYNASIINRPGGIDHERNR